MPKTKRVLLAEACADNREMLGTLLELWGYEVRVAANGPAALQTAVAYRPDVVIMDLALPGKDGLAVARALRLRREFAHTRLIALTGYGQEKYRRQAFEAGFDEHVIKSTDPEDLHRLLEVPDESVVFQQQWPLIARSSSLVSIGFCR